MAEAFVYSWRNKKTDRIYIGWHKGLPDDGYICSSKIVLEEYEKNPSDFERFIVARGSADDMGKLETEILKSVNAKDDPSFYNQHNGNGLYHCKEHSLQARAKISLAQIGRKFSIEAKESMREAAKNRKPGSHAGCQKGKPKSAAHIAALRASRKPITEETRAKLRASKLGIKRGPYKKTLLRSTPHGS